MNTNNADNELDQCKQIKTYQNISETREMINSNGGVSPSVTSKLYVKMVISTRIWSAQIMC